MSRGGGDTGDDVNPEMIEAEAREEPDNTAHSPQFNHT